jgi:hypothetical protein
MGMLKIIGVIPGKARMDSSTPGRKFLQVIMVPLTEGRTLNTQNDVSRNVWEGYKGERLEGGDLNIKADPLYISICEALGIDENTPWEEASFRGIKGFEVEGEIITEIVEPYEIPGSLSADKRRVEYTLAVFKNESKYKLFKAQNHPIVEDPKRREQLRLLASEVASTNEAARQRRMEARGMPTPSERKGTGALVDKQQYSGKHLES